MDKKNIIIHIGIITISALLFIPFLGRVHLFDWDEINFAESAREMIVTGDYLSVRIFFEPFWEKPPLFIWLQVISMKLFGINEFAARFPNAICGILTLLILFNLGKKLFNTRFGLLWVLAYGGSLLPFFYFKSGIIDPWFNLFIFTSIGSWVYAIDASSKSKYLFSGLSATLLGLAILTKGPVSIIIFGIVVFILFLFKRLKIGLNWKHITVYILVLLFVGGFWFILQILAGNYDIVKDFIIYQIRLFSTKDAGHGGFPLYHFVILLVGVFPASVFAIQGHKYTGEKDRKWLMHIAMVSLLWVVLILFSVVKTKIVHYTSLTYFPLTYLASYSAYQIIKGKFQFRIWQKTLLAFIGIIFAAFIIFLPILVANKDLLIEKGLITHSFTIGNLQANPNWTFYHSLIGIIILIGVVIPFLPGIKKPANKIISLYYSSILFIFLVITMITPGAEKISQNASIEFIKEKSKEDAYIHSFFKSYAILFYAEQKIPADKIVFNNKWLTSKLIDKDVYFVMRIDKKMEVLQQYPNVEVLYEKNGYVFGINRVSESEN